MNVTLVYMLAGMSSRFGGKPKHFARVGPNGETMLEISLSQALKAGFSKIIFIIRKETLNDFLKLFGREYGGMKINYAFQKFNPYKRDKPWGTADALCCASKFIDCPFVVCNGDDIYGEKIFQILVEHLKNNQTYATVGYKLINTLPETGSVNRGIFEIDNNYEVISLKETYDITKENFREKGLSEDSLCSQNIFGFHPDILDKFSKNLIEFQKQHEDDRKTEFLLPVELNKLIKKKDARVKLYYVNEKFIGITNPRDEEFVRKILIKDNEPISP